MTRPTRPRVGVLLAGGAGARFGGVAKGLLACGTARLADPALAALHATCDTVLVAANDAAAATWFPGHAVIGDAVPGLGALGALHTALQYAATHDHDSVVLVCAWDMPFVTAPLLARLAHAVDAGAACCVPVHADGRSEPLCAAYSVTCAAPMTAMLARGDRAAHAVREQVGGAAWEIDAMLSPREVRRVFFNVNTPDDLRQAASWLTPQPALQ